MIVQHQNGGNGPRFRYGECVTAMLIMVAVFAFLLDPYHVAEELQRVSTCRSENTINFKPNYPGWAAKPQDPKICLTLTTTASVETLVPWILFHRTLGVAAFFLFVEGEAAKPHSRATLQSIEGVTVIVRSKSLAEDQKKSLLMNEPWMVEHLHRPCSHKHFVQKALDMEGATHLAKMAGMQWILALDDDELVHPAGGSSYSLTSLLKDIHPKTDAVVFLNHEAVPERENVHDPFTDVSLFKKSLELSPEETVSRYRSSIFHRNPSYFLSYGIGKLAARVQSGLRPFGLYRWTNSNKTLKQEVLNEAVILHFPYTRISDLSVGGEQCGCHYKPKDAEACFMNTFDHDAYTMAKSLSPAPLLNWFRNHVVWSNPKVVIILLRLKVFTRIHAPQVIMQGMREIGVFQDIVEKGQRVIEESALQIGSQNKSYSPTPTGDWPDEIQEMQKIFHSLSSGRQIKDSQVSLEKEK